MADDHTPPPDDNAPHQLPLLGFDAEEDDQPPSEQPGAEHLPEPAPDGTLSADLLERILNAPPDDDLKRLAAQVRALDLAPAAAKELAEVARPGPPVIGALLGVRSPQERVNALRMIRHLREPVDVEPIIKAIYDRRQGAVRLEATRTLGAIGAWVEWESPLVVRIVHALTVAARHQKPDVRIEAAVALGRLPVDSAEKALLERLEVEKNPRVRDAVALALGSLKSADAVRALLNSYETGEIPYDVALKALANLGKEATEPLMGALRRWNVRLISREIAALALARIGTEAVLEPLLEIVRRPHEPVDMRIAAVRALRELGDMQASPVLWGVYREPGLSDELRRVIKSTIDTLREQHGG